MASRLVRSILYCGRAAEVLRCIARVKNWYPFLAHYLQVERGYPFTLHARLGFSIELECWEDVTTAWVNLCRREYHVQKNPKRMIDLGANIGCFTIWNAFRYPGVKIEAVEPSPTTFARLQRLIQCHQLESRVRLHNRAISASNMELLFDIAGPSHSHFVTDTPSEKTIRVPSMTLPKLFESFEDQVDFMKVDIEGGEYDLFRNTSKESLARVDKIGIEYHPNGKLNELLHDLTSKGFVQTHQQRLGDGLGIVHCNRVKK